MISYEPAGLVKSLELFAAVIAASAAAGGSLLFLYRFGGRVYRTWRLVDRLYAEFGSDPLASLLELIRDIEASHGELEIRQRISERHLEVGIYICQRADEGGGLIWANDWLCETLGLDSRQMEGQGSLLAVAPEYRQHSYEKWQHSIKHNIPYVDEMEIIPPSGKDPFMVKTQAWPVKNRKGEIIFYVGYTIRADRLPHGVFAQDT